MRQLSRSPKSNHYPVALVLCCSTVASNLRLRQMTGLLFFCLKNHGGSPSASFNTFSLCYHLTEAEVRDSKTSRTEESCSRVNKGLTVRLTVKLDRVVISQDGKSQLNASQVAASHNWPFSFVGGKQQKSRMKHLQGRCRTAEAPQHFFSAINCYSKGITFTKM